MRESSKTVFVSYAHETSDISETIASYIRNTNGFEVFIDRDNIEHRIDLDISKALKQSIAMVVIWSRAARRSEWVHHEIVSFCSTHCESSPLVFVQTDDENEYPLDDPVTVKHDTPSWKQELVAHLTSPAPFRREGRAATKLTSSDATIKVFRAEVAHRRELRKKDAHTKRCPVRLAERTWENEVGALNSITSRVAKLHKYTSTNVSLLDLLHVCAALRRASLGAACFDLTKGLLRGLMCGLSWTVLATTIVTSLVQVDTTHVSILRPVLVVYPFVFFATAVVATIFSVRGATVGMALSFLVGTVSTLTASLIPIEFPSGLHQAPSDIVGGLTAGVYVSSVLTIWSTDMEARLRSRNSCQWVPNAAVAVVGFVATGVLLATAQILLGVIVLVLVLVALTRLTYKKGAIPATVSLGVSLVISATLIAWLTSRESAPESPDQAIFDAIWAGSVAAATLAVFVALSGVVADGMRAVPLGSQLISQAASVVCTGAVLHMTSAGSRMPLFFPVFTGTVVFGAVVGVSYTCIAKRRNRSDQRSSVRERHDHAIGR